jgi:hypothetical protein
VPKCGYQSRPKVAAIGHFEELVGGRQHHVLRPQLPRQLQHRGEQPSDATGLEPSERLDLPVLKRSAAYLVRLISRLVVDDRGWEAGVRVPVDAALQDVGLVVDGHHADDVQERLLV